MRITSTAIIILATVVMFPIHATAQMQHTDTAARQSSKSVRRFEVTPHMMTSPLPVTIHQQGRHLCVQSRYNQLLPIYTESGVFYTAFRLSKGTNWLSGLPKGTYLINNRKFIIY